MVLRVRQRLIDAQRKQIDAAFRSRSVSSSTASLAFDPTTAILVHEHEAIYGSGESRPLVQVTRVYRSTFGEYVLFICSAGSQGFIKHLSRSEAMHALRPHKAAFLAEFGTAGSEKRQNEA